MEKLKAVLEKLKVFMDSAFTGSVTFNFHKGDLSKRIEIRRIEEI